MRSRALMVCWALLVGGSGAAAQLTVADRQGAVTRLWSGARYHFAYWDRVKADWDSAFAASLAAAARPQTDLAFYRQLRRFAALLEHGATAILPASPARDRAARPPLEIAAIESRPFILDYVENDEMRVARPQRLAEIVAVQGVPAERWVTDSVLPETPGGRPEERWHRAVRDMLAGARGTAVHLLLRNPDGQTRGASVTRSVTAHARWPLRPPALEVDTLPDHSVWVRLNDFTDPDLARDFDRAFPDFAGVRGLVLDLRGNASPTAGDAYTLLARLVSRPFVTVRWRTPQYRAADVGSGNVSPMTWHWGGPDTVRPRTDRPTYAGPLAVLAGPATGGAAEDFLVALRNASRGPIIGEPTAGHGGRTVTLPLTHDWQFVVCATRHSFPNGAEFADTGIAPEQLVTTTVTDVLNGRDAPLDRAREYFSTRASQGR
jgi:carboxyl-terminal processing protease